MTPADNATTPIESLGPPRRVIKRYSNRKLYDTQDSRYVTLQQVAELVREGIDVQVIDNATREDKTDVTLALIISEELRTRPRGIPISTLKMLVRARGEKLLLQLKGGALGSFFTKDDPSETASDASEGHPPQVPFNDPERLANGPPETDGTATGFWATLEQWQRTVDDWQHSVDERMRAVLPSFTAFRDLQQETAQLRDRVAALERRLEELQARSASE